jgi:hypothetical protein
MTKPKNMPIVGIAWAGIIRLSVKGVFVLRSHRCAATLRAAGHRADGGQDQASPWIQAAWLAPKYIEGINGCAEFGAL